MLIYQVISEKIPSARFMYVFVLNGEKPLLSDFVIQLPQQEEAPAQQQAGQQ